jgi:hypothetical protein
LQDPDAAYEKLNSQRWTRSSAKNDFEFEKSLHWLAFPKFQTLEKLTKKKPPVLAEQEVNFLGDKQLH